MKVGITGQNGFVGRHLYNTLGLYPDEFVRVDFRKEYFDDEKKLDQFVSQCDTIVHLAAMNRHESEQVIYETNVELVRRLIAALERTGSKAHVLVSSSTQEERDNLYGRSKKEGREALISWAQANGGKLTGLLIPNVFGAFGKPFYNSFIATFCFQLTHGEIPTIANDGFVNLIYVQELVEDIIRQIREKVHQPLYTVQSTATKKVSEVLELLENFRDLYLYKGEIPVLHDRFELNLFNTYRSFIDHQAIYPRKFQLHTDPRGTFVEIIRMGIGGQSSYSTTVPGITRGNHFHTRKIERFAVIQGKARIQLRKMDTDEVMDFYLDGTEPSFVDMPIWYTHNITNIGDVELITCFWINEPYDPADPDTYFLEV
ncbi:UDP-2-acetamido-2,6-beta-L-arabino-hexul-4-ose reductase [Sphingobacterium allocomposti]|uniref:UDP-2-acetamido-2,6-beta-L-arabino-hexul-4-ose reductase n=1 Tax=Sphingobacterium allocomposti TaxID=415956 RepID=A0A5S5DEW7_9SPHI|nr:NAD-dependent epimerase/dehydratase family protein [Sphingobacterium composti Yoo et al. 2007 non Ten et al. 2007]TYP94603.1 UDP-2-acetamido-2,6-beta-L-arabino-hexul-4-ose reductase [Sphingobacterium composti Yoo et al. 2007 non Ten et al. 2007]